MRVLFWSCVWTYKSERAKPWFEGRVRIVKIEPWGWSVGIDYAGLCHVSVPPPSLAQVLFRAGDAADSIYILCAGHVRLTGPQPEAGASTATADAAAAASTSMEYGPGCLIGSSDFYLHRASSMTARCASASCRLLVLQRGAYARLMGEQPGALGLLQFAVTRSLCLELATSLELVDRLQ